MDILEKNKIESERQRVNGPYSDGHIRLSLTGSVTEEAETDNGSRRKKRSGKR